LHRRAAGEFSNRDVFQVPQQVNGENAMIIMIMTRIQFQVVDKSQLVMQKQSAHAGGQGGGALDKKRKKNSLQARQSLSKKRSCPAPKNSSTKVREN
jgi:hypothetical protein